MELRITKISLREFLGVLGYWEARILAGKECGIRVLGGREKGCWYRGSNMLSWVREKQRKNREQKK